MDKGSGTDPSQFMLGRFADRQSRIDGLPFFKGGPERR